MAIALTACHVEKPRRRDRWSRGLLLAALLSAVGLGWGGCATDRATDPRPDHASLERRVMVGYQGWFRTPNDGSGMGWAHYHAAGTMTFEPGKLHIDFWPDVGELPESSRVDTAFRHDDGSVAQVFSSHDPQVVELHFRWMREHGIDGAFVQRFSAPIIGDSDSARRGRQATDDVLRYALASAERHGRSVAVMYDLSGMPAGAMDRVMQDWRHLVDDLRVRASAACQRHRARPVVAVWGVGFNDHRAYTLEETEALIDFLKNDPVYGGNTVMLGIPTWWREQTADATADPRFHAVLQKADILSPWTPGRFHDLGGVRAHAERFWIPDRAWCAERGLDYLPVVFPGFSWRNLKHTKGGIDRADGRFLWEQYRQLINSGFTMVYQAMFDEMDEGTQVFKTSNRVPIGANTRTYAPLPEDYYLWLVGRAADRLHRRGPLAERIVARPGDELTNRHLREGDEAIYAAVPESLAAHRSFFAIGDALMRMAANSGSASVSEGERVQVTGQWFPRWLWSNDAAAAVSWTIDGLTAGEHVLHVRWPGDPNQDHASAARLRVLQAGALLAEFRVDLRQRTLRWNELGRVRVPAAGACEIVLDRDGTAGSLVLFEPRLQKRE